MAELWVAAAGAVGGALNAWLTANRNLFPVRVAAGSHTIIRPGLTASTGIGLAAAVAVGYAFAGMDWGYAVASGRGAQAGVTAAFFIGVLSAHSVSSVSDRRLLRAAVCLAAASPAAHPDTIAEMEVATPPAMLEAASRLVPHHRRHPQV